MSIYSKLDKKTDKKFGIIILLTLLIFPAFIATFMALYRLFNVKIKIKPIVFLGNRSFGKISIWATIMLITAFLYFTLIILPAYDWGIALFIIFIFGPLPSIFTAILLFGYNSLYENHVRTAITLISKLTSKEEIFNKSDCMIINNYITISYKSSVFRKILNELKELEIISFTENELTYKIYLIDWETEHNKSKIIDPWECKSCGAINETDSTCEYCGNSRISDTRNAN